MSPTEQFIDAIRSAGLNPPDSIIADGNIHQFSSNGKPRDSAGRYAFYENQKTNGGIFYAGWFQCWRTGLSQNWHQDIDFTKAERKDFQKKIEEGKRMAEAERAATNLEAKKKAVETWNAAEKDRIDHPYLVEKSVKSYGLRVLRKRLIIPIRQNKEIISLQYIFLRDGHFEKWFLAGGAYKGGYFVIGGNPDQRLLICEGYATGATLYEATGYPVTVAFTAGNLVEVSQYLREAFPSIELYICADDDFETDGNPGIKSATDTAIAINGFLAKPDFEKYPRKGKETDFNDLMQSYGLEAVKDCVDRALKPLEVAATEEWPEPQELVNAEESEEQEFPLDDLPADIRDAVKEVVDNVQCPVPLAVCSAFGVLSLAAQPLAKVQIKKGIEVPLSLYLMVVAESSERKTSCDTKFSSFISGWEKEQRETKEPELQKYTAEISAWKAKYSGIEAQIKQLAKQSKSTDELTEKLIKLEQQKPQKVKIPRLLKSDITSEALAWQLKDEWPSAGLIISEGGTFVGGHSMLSENIQRNLSLYNELWSGKSFKVDRRGSESFSVHGATVMICLSIQPQPITRFMTSEGGLARANGFFSRFLITFPQSTQGGRFEHQSKEIPIGGHLDSFKTKIERLLNHTVGSFEKNEGKEDFEPEILIFSEGAKKEWIKYSDEIEKELAVGGDMCEIKDVAGKSADNAARLAGLFHIFENGSTGGEISQENMLRGANIAAWFLYNSRRFFSKIALPPEIANAIRLEAWILGRCKKDKVSSISTRYVKQHASVRGEKADVAINKLIEYGRLKEVPFGKKGKHYRINPKLVEWDIEFTR